MFCKLPSAELCFKYTGKQKTLTTFSNCPHPSLLFSKFPCSTLSQLLETIKSNNINRETKGKGGQVLQLPCLPIVPSPFLCLSLGKFQNSQQSEPGLHATIFDVIMLTCNRSMLFHPVCQSNFMVFRMLSKVTV